MLKMEFTQRKRPLIEICCCSTDDAMQAYLGGADRIELNSCLEVSRRPDAEHWQLKIGKTESSSTGDCNDSSAYRRFLLHFA